MSASERTKCLHLHFKAEIGHLQRADETQLFAKLTAGPDANTLTSTALRLRNLSIHERGLSLGIKGDVRFKDRGIMLQIMHMQNTNMWHKFCFFISF